MNLTNENKVLAGLLLISLLVCLFAYFTFTPLSVSGLKKIEGTLLEKPVSGEQGGEIPEKFIRIRLNEDDKDYYLKNCAFNAAQTNKILKLEPGSRIMLFIRKSSDRKKDPEVLQFATGNDVLLSLDDYNRCKRSKWKMLIPFILIFMILMLGRLVIGTRGMRIKKS